MEILIGLLSIAIGIFLGLFFGLRGFRLQIVPTLHKIEEHTRFIKDIKDIAIKIDERTKLFLPIKRTVKGVLKNLGEVEISAEPGRKGTDYFIKVKKPILKAGPIEKISLETGLVEKEKELFGQEPTFTLIDARRIIYHLPSTDPKICSEYITFFLKWLDSRYFESLKKLEEYEKITF